jgi:hypothetical protein
VKDVKEVNDVKEVKDEEFGRERCHYSGMPGRLRDVKEVNEANEVKDEEPVVEVRGKFDGGSSFTSLTSSTSFTSKVFYDE